MSGELIFPFLILMLLMAAAIKRLPIYDLFVRGAKSGMQTAVDILPNLAAMLCAISLFQTSGLMEALSVWFAPAAKILRLPAETVPLVLLRPVSGSASLAMLENLLAQYGADSRTGLIASVIMGSSETIFYTVCVYMSAAGEKKTGYAIPCALAGMLAGTCVAGMLF